MLITSQTTRSGRYAQALALLAVVTCLGACDQSTTPAPDPAQVSVSVNEARGESKAGIKQPLAIPRGIEAEPARAAQAKQPVALVSAKGALEDSAEQGSGQGAEHAGEQGAEHAAEPASPAEVTTLGGDLEIKRLVVTTAIEQREPVAGSVFKTGEVVFAFVELKNAAEAEHDVVITFEHVGGRKVGHVELNIPGKQQRWRTWGRTQNINLAGEWDAVVRTKAGTELARTRFSVS